MNGACFATSSVVREGSFGGSKRIRAEMSVGGDLEEVG